jgi:glutamine synthetase
MSLPRLDSFDPSGWHLHQSVMDTKAGRNLFAADGNADGISPDGASYVSGVLARARDFCLLSVPTVNGYRRLDPSFSLAPTRIGWSFEDRGAMIRVLGGEGSAHIENRVGEPCANPYLAIASQLFAGLDGLVSNAGPGGPEAVPGGPGTGAVPAAAAETLPQSLRAALDAFRGSHVQELLGQPLADCLTKIKESEVTRFEAWCADERPPEGEVTDWEQREYFDAF